ncbi:hypothetical protein GJ496_002169 [Pomphorhynchus laevis]|nr:hypothetical protein GJ496_002169 [Pomphorhynchus laevis]
MRQSKRQALRSQAKEELANADSKFIIDEPVRTARVLKVQPKQNNIFRAKSPAAKRRRRSPINLRNTTTNTKLLTVRTGRSSSRSSIQSRTAKRATTMPKSKSPSKRNKRSAREGSSLRSKSRTTESRSRQATRHNSKSRSVVNSARSKVQNMRISRSPSLRIQTLRSYHSQKQMRRSPSKTKRVSPKKTTPFKMFPRRRMSPKGGRTNTMSVRRKQKSWAIRFTVATFAALLISLMVAAYICCNNNGSTGKYWEMAQKRIRRSFWKR